MRASRIGVGVLAAALALAGCDGSTTTTSPNPSASSTVAPTFSPAPGTSASGEPGPTSSASPAPSGAGRPPTPTSADIVALVRSGGIAGKIVAVTVLPDGTWKRGNGRSIERSGKLTAAQAAKLHTLTADPRLAAEAQRPPTTKSACADVYNYMLVAGGHSVRYTDCPSQNDKPVVTMQIAALLQDATN